MTTAAGTHRARRTPFAVFVAAVVALWATGGSVPAGADVTGTSGSATGVFVTTGLLGTLVPPTPTVTGASPPINYGPFANTTLDLNVPSVVRAQNVNVLTFGLVNPDPHLNSANSSASIERASVGADSLVLNAVAVSCAANGDDAVGAMTIASGTLGPNPIVGGPVAPNTTLELPGVLRVVLNEQIPTPQPDTPGINTITVNGAHVTLLASPIAGVPAGVEIILAQAACTATGPDVNATTTTTAPGGTTTTTAPAGTTTTTAPGGTTTTTAPGGTTTTVAGGTTTTTVDSGTTTTTVAGATTTTVAGATTTTLAGATTTTAAITAAGGPTTPLARTGGPALRWALIAIAVVALGMAVAGGANQVPEAVGDTSLSSLRKRLRQRQGWPNNIRRR